jgi:Ca-activated chloride channel family protein
VFTTIRDHLDEENVFAFGIGSAVNRYLIEGLAHAGLGEAFMVHDSAHAGEVARRFRSYIESPVLTHVRLEADGFDAFDLEPAHLPDLFADRPIVVEGRFHGAPTGTLRLSGRTAAGPWSQTLSVAAAVPIATGGALATLWARDRIASLSDFATGDEAKEAVTELGLEHHLMTRFTSFIAVHHVVRNPGDPAADVDQPVPLPHGVEESAVGMTQGDEPGLLVLVMICMAIAGTAFLARVRS